MQYIQLKHITKVYDIINLISTLNFILIVDVCSNNITSINHNNMFAFYIKKFDK
ncbi:hypothetical protein XSR1_610003 [Xenorhabdus szentirmaii DSM 16338]|uniref:Uncharacterized protein n=1 Tax=Xenorhabdus szentirmaii DSM 16338 TaxID=1427518 RepID=W1J5L1_9GAMM|nr:hypothetical protein XSR1_610003 [Xenorhabdus szentirmaii DSM 16338]